MAQVGDMLRLARQRLGFTQKKAAGMIGIPQPVLSRYENEISEPDEDFLLRASDVYRIPRKFFDLKSTVYGPPVSVHPMPRAKADVTARDLDMVTAELNLRAMYLRRFLESVDFEPSSNLPELRIEEWGSAARVASVLRSQWGLPRGPIKNLTKLVESAGVIVGMSDFSGASISGMTFKIPGHPPLVLINSSHPADRMRFTLAHELGHIVMHRFPTPTMEAEANEFASNFLMPDADIKPSFFGRKITLELLASLKPEWRVAMQALLMKAKSLNMLTPNQERYLWSQISARGWKTSEPPELDFPHETPKVMKSILDAHIKTFGFSIKELSALVPLHEAEFIGMFGDIENNTPPKPRLTIVS